MGRSNVHLFRNGVTDDSYLNSKGNLASVLIMRTLRCQNCFDKKVYRCTLYTQPNNVQQTEGLTSKIKAEVKTKLS